MMVLCKNAWYSLNWASSRFVGLRDGLLYGSQGTLVLISCGVRGGVADSGVIGALSILRGVMIGAPLGELVGLMGLILLLLLRFCLDFLSGGTFFCVERILSVGVVIKRGKNL